MASSEAAPARAAWLNRLLAAASLAGAWLLFQVEPMAAKRVLPWFGGGAGVWNAALLFFQTALLAGYAYAHWIARRLEPRAQVAVHGTLLAAAAALMAMQGVLPGAGWKPPGSDLPAWRIVAALAASVGPSFVLLAATAPLTQVWFARANPGASPYRLYALSNAGSLAALLSYPVLVEPNVGVARQATLWALGFAAFAVLMTAAGRLALRRGAVAAPADAQSPARDADAADRASDKVASERAEPEVRAAEDAGVEASVLEHAGLEDAGSGGAGVGTTRLAGEAGGEAAGAGRPRWLEIALWLALPACASVALLAVTAYLSQDVASFPLLWVLPLATYLVTFIVAFDSDRWSHRWFWLGSLAVTSFVAVYTWTEGSTLDIAWQVVAHLALLMSLGMACHGELARMRPAPERLTSFYLCLAAGGAVGGFLTTFVAPLVLPDRYELQLSILAAWALAVVVLVTDRRSVFYDGGSFQRLASIGAAWALLALVMWINAAEERRTAIDMSRNFYGVLEVCESHASDPYRSLVNGRISHGAQYLRPENRRAPTQYYMIHSAIGKLLTMPSRPAPRRVGVVGLGAGTLATYAEAGDEFRFYEINPDVPPLAEKYFTYLSDARERGADVKIVLGDARLALEREPPQQFDVLVLDAFTGDAIPVHLLTREAFDVYARHLAEPDGVLAVHVSNIHLELGSVVRTATDRLGMDAVGIVAEADESPAAERSIWILATRERGYFARFGLRGPLAEPSADLPRVEWTDDYSNVVGILK